MLVATLRDTGGVVVMLPEEDILALCGPLLMLDQRVMVQTRDPCLFMGDLSAVDNLGNICLTNTIQRVGEKYAEVSKYRWYMFRGENVVLMGEIDKNKHPLTDLERVSSPEIAGLQKSVREELWAEERKLRRNPPNSPSLSGAFEE